MEDEKLVPAEVEDDKASSNGSGSTASQSSEEFVKVNKDDASLEDAAGHILREDVQDLSPMKNDSPFEFGQKMTDKIDPRTIPTESMASDSYLKDYYDQLPSETAEFVPGESSDLLDSAHAGDETCVLQPDVVQPQDSHKSQLVEAEAGLAGELSQGGHASFEPVPAASFELDPVEAVPRLDQPTVRAVEPTVEEELEALSESNLLESDPMASVTQEQSIVSPEDDAQGYEAEAELQPAVELDMKAESEHDIIVEDVPEEESPPPEMTEFSQLPVVEDVVEINLQPTPVSASFPTAVLDLVHWRDIKKTASVLSFLLLMLISLICYSVISVVAYAGLSLLTVTVAFRVFKLVLQTLNGTQQPHPFQDFLDADIALSPERIQKYATAIASHLNCCVTSARDLFMVKNTIGSLKFGVFLWLLTYLGALFNGLTLIIIGVIMMFTLPPIHEKYQTQIDTYCGMARDKVCDLVAKVKAKLPGSKRGKEKAQ